MALNGSLAEFSVAEVFQLLALQQKSGVLVLTHAEGHTHVFFFERGRILAAADRRRESRHPFLRYLDENLLLSRDQVDTVEDLTRQAGQDLFTVLLTTGLMGRDRLGAEMQNYAQRIIDEVVTWHSGTYEFSGDERSLPHQGFVVKVSPEELLMESMRRGDELSTLKDSLIASDHILSKSPNPPSGALPRECTVVLGLIDGTRTVAEVCRHSPLGEYLTYDAIAELLGRQQVIVLDPAHAGHLAPARESRAAVSITGWAALAAPVVFSLLVGAAAGPALRRSAGSQGWLPAEIATDRSALDDAMRVDVSEIRRRFDR